MLHGAGGNPDIVGCNRGAGLLQGNADGCVTVRRLFVHDKHADARDELIWFIWFVLFIWLIWLVSFN